MNSLATSAVVFVCVFGGALLGFLLRSILPEDHLSPASRDLVKLGIGTIATMSALVLGLLVSSAKSSYDAQSRELTEMSAKIILLDRVLSHYGPEAKEARDVLRDLVSRLIERTWPKDRASRSMQQPVTSNSEPVYDKIQELVPANDTQRALQNRASERNCSRHLLSQRVVGFWRDVPYSGDVHTAGWVHRGFKRTASGRSRILGPVSC